MIKDKVINDCRYYDKSICACAEYTKYIDNEMSIIHVCENPKDRPCYIPIKDNAVTTNDCCNEIMYKSLLSPENLYYNISVHLTDSNKDDESKMRAVKNLIHSNIVKYYK